MQNFCVHQLRILGGILCTFRGNPCTLLGGICVLHMGGICVPSPVSLRIITGSLARVNSILNLLKSSNKHAWEVFLGHRLNESLFLLLFFATHFLEKLQRKINSREVWIKVPWQIREKRPPACFQHMLRRVIADNRLKRAYGQNFPLFAAFKSHRIAFENATPSICAFTSFTKRKTQVINWWK